jgi:hypothetical protein
LAEHDAAQTQRKFQSCSHILNGLPKEGNPFPFVAIILKGE